MPTFPTYRGNLPKCLNLFNLRHYLLLTYWVFFRPTALKCYCYQADSHLYWTGGGLNIFRTLWVPAYRNLYLMVIAISVLSSTLVGIPITLVSSWSQHKQISLVGLAVVSILQGLLSLKISLIYVVLYGMTFGVASGFVPGVSVGVAFGVMFGISLSVVLDVTSDVMSRAVVGIPFGLALSAVMSSDLGLTLGLMGSIGVVFLYSELFSQVEGLRLVIGIGILRGIFYPFQLYLALHSRFQRKGHPLEWDELVVLPLPKTQQVLTRSLQENIADGLHFVADVARNPFQRWAAQKSLQTYLHNQLTPIHFLYALITFPKLDECVVAPKSKPPWEGVPTTRQLLLAELNGQGLHTLLEPPAWHPIARPVALSMLAVLTLPERLVWLVTWILRDHRKTALTRFAGLLNQLLDANNGKVQEFDLSRYRKTYTDLLHYPGGVEIAESFETFIIFLSFNALSVLPSAVGIVSRLRAIDTSIRPTVLTVLSRLGEVGAEVARHQNATSRVNKLTALARATDALNNLDKYVAAEVMAPEQAILHRIIRQWQRLVSEVIGEVGRADDFAPVANPYVIGNPVRGHLFVGREDILRELEELWAKEGQCSSVVLFGHRRMGKSSILQNLGDRFGAGTIIVNFNMENYGWAQNNGELLFNLALQLYDSWRDSGHNDLAEPEEAQFLNHNPYMVFNRFLTNLNRVVKGERFIITVDEFEIIEEGINEGRFDSYLLRYWRGTFQNYPWFIMAFAGLHNLEEMRRDYWNPFYGSVKSIPVSFLSPNAARRLITQPDPNFAIDYESEAVEKIIKLTNGQPYLVQLICHTLVTHFNRQTFEEGIERERWFTVEDVEAVINAPEFYRDGNAYFNGVWVQAETSEPTGQVDILKALSHTSLSLSAIANKTGLSLEQAQAVLETLKRHDVIEQRDEHYVYTVELMRRWVERREGQ